jgi:hypothetical protein
LNIMKLAKSTWFWNTESSGCGSSKPYCEPHLERLYWNIETSGCGSWGRWLWTFWST